MPGETSKAETQCRFQGNGGTGYPQLRADAGRAGAAVCRAPEPDRRLEDAAGGWDQPVWRAGTGGGTGIRSRFEAAEFQVRGVDAGTRFLFGALAKAGLLNAKR